MILVRRARELGRSIVRRRPEKGEARDVAAEPDRAAQDAGGSRASTAAADRAEDAGRETDPAGDPGPQAGSRGGPVDPVADAGLGGIGWWMIVQASWAGHALWDPFRLALFRGEADPPPGFRRLSFRVPRRLAALLPMRAIGLVQLADLIVALVLYGVMLSMVMEWNDWTRATHARIPVSPGPISDMFLYLTALGVSVPVALRDTRPLAAWRIAIVLLPVYFWVARAIGSLDPPYALPIVVMYLLVCYSVAVRCEKRITFALWIVTVLIVWINDPNSMAIATVVVSVAVLFGYNVRVRRSATDRLMREERRSLEAEGAQAVLEERARIARELHDVVAHHMSVIAIQAEAVPLKAAGDPVQLEAGLAEIRGLSLEAIAELRQVLGVLRDPQGRTDTAPQPGLDRVDELVANARAAGLAVLVKRSGSLGGLSSAAELSAYRIVQESLSNVMRHAPGATVAVEITRKGHDLRLRLANGPPASGGSGDVGPGSWVDDAGSGVEGRAGRGARQGLVGMRERVALLGGTLDAGPDGKGGFEVRATLPIADREGL